MGKYLKPLGLNELEITDTFFGQYVKKVSEKIIPHQWKILNNQLEEAEPTYCIQNFRIAAGEAEGKRQGVVFQDSDLYKWLESVAYCLAGGQGKGFEELADEVIGLIGRAQEPDGYLNTYYTVNAPDKKWTNLVEGHELYVAGHMIEAAVAYYTATGKEQFLMIAKKKADLICSVFGREERQLKGYPGHQEIELALIKLYRVTGQKKYLETAKYFIEQRGKEPNYFTEEIKQRGKAEFFREFEDYELTYSQSHIEPVKQDSAEGHAVRMMYMCAAMADLAEEFEDKEMLAACERIWNNMTAKRMYITGGIGSSGFQERFTTDYDLPNSTNYSETCASIGVMMFGQRMASATGNAKYYDIVEQALYNTVIAGINIEGDRYFYVNPLEVVPEFCKEHTYMNHVKPVRQKWFSVACCPPNIARTLASLGQYIYARDEKALYIHQFISSRGKVHFNDETMEVDMDSGLLKDGTVTICIRSESDRKVKIRIPQYAENVKIIVNGEKKEAVYVNGYFTANVSQGSNSIKLDFAVTPRWLTANEKVRANNGKAVLLKGPMVYCLEEADNGNLLSQIYVEENVPVKEADSAEKFPGQIPALEYDGYRLKNRQEDMERLYCPIEYEKVKTVLKAVPYCMWNNRGEGEMLVWHKVIIS